MSAGKPRFFGEPVVSDVGGCPVVSAQIKCSHCGYECFEINDPTIVCRPGERIAFVEMTVQCESCTGRTTASIRLDTAGEIYVTAHHDFESAT